MPLIDEYVSRLHEACGEERDFIVTLKYAKKEEAIKKILEKCKAHHTISNILTRCTYKDKEVSVFVTGKVVIKGFKGRKEAEEFLKDLLY